MAKRGNRRPAAERRTKAAAAPPVKLEIEDPLYDEHGPVDKRFRVSPLFHQLPRSLLEEPSPLGLRLRKSPSLLELIQARLDRADSSADAGKEELKPAASIAADKLKASNFPISLLRIGSWECVSRHEGDLVAKCYFAKQKLVWEFLDGGLKNKIEIQWSNITALKAALPENGHGTLDIGMSKRPTFYRETNPQPRKHTLWQAAEDFTGGQASMHRRHFVQCAQGLLNKHLEKILQCDPRLNALCRQPDIILESPYFNTRRPISEDKEESKGHDFDYMKDVCASAMSGSRDLGSPSVAMSASTTSEATIGWLPDNVLPETSSPNSVIDSRVTEEITGKRSEESSSKCWEQVKFPLLGGSMSMNDLMNHIGHRISDQTTSGIALLSADGSRSKYVMDDLAQYLLDDSQFSSASDEQSVTSRVDSLCCLLQKESSATKSLHIHGGETADGNTSLDEHRSVPEPEPEPASGTRPLFDLSVADDSNDASPHKQQQPPRSIHRNESFGELIMNLPRIASLPKVLFNIENNNRAK